MLFKNTSLISVEQMRNLYAAMQQKPCSVIRKGGHVATITMGNVQHSFTWGETAVFYKKIVANKVVLQHVALKH